MLRHWIIATLVCLMAMLPAQVMAQAKVTFSAYEGPEVIKAGEGGTKVTKNGIDYWTSGTPPKKYQVIGMVQDKRDEMWDGGHAIGSPNIANKVKKAGGDAVIIQSQDEAGKNGSFGTGLWGGMFMGGGSKTITVMLVVKYLPEAPTAASAPAPSKP